jgi:hypothetical protein
MYNICSLSAETKYTAHRRPLKKIKSGKVYGPDMKIKVQEFKARQNNHCFKRPKIWR